MDMRYINIIYSYHHYYYVKSNPICQRKQSIHRHIISSSPEYKKGRSNKKKGKENHILGELKCNMIITNEVMRSNLQVVLAALVTQNHLAIPAETQPRLSHN